MELGLVGRASRGLGRACAEALAREGAAVTIVARDADRLARAAAEIGAAGAATVAAVSPTSGPSATPAPLATCPYPDILVTNAEGRPQVYVRAWSRAACTRRLDA